MTGGGFVVGILWLGLLLLVISSLATFILTRVVKRTEGAVTSDEKGTIKA